MKTFLILASSLFLFLVAIRDSQGWAANIIITEPYFNMITNRGLCYCLCHPAKWHVHWALKLLLISVTFKIQLGIISFTLGHWLSLNRSLLHLKPYASPFVCKSIPTIFWKNWLMVANVCTLLNPSRMCLKSGFVDNQPVWNKMTSKCFFYNALNNIQCLLSKTTMVNIFINDFLALLLWSRTS